MKQQDKITINNMRLDGYSPSAIATALGLPQHCSVIYPSLSQYSRHQMLQTMRKTYHTAQEQPGKEILLRSLPDALVEQPSGGCQSESILYTGMSALRKGV